MLLAERGNNHDAAREAQPSWSEKCQKEVLCLLSTKGLYIFTPV
jgi:hypothetical protein